MAIPRIGFVKPIAIATGIGLIGGFAFFAVIDLVSGNSVDSSLLVMALAFGLFVAFEMALLTAIMVLILNWTYRQVRDRP